MENPSLTQQEKDAKEIAWLFTRYTHEEGRDIVQLLVRSHWMRRHEADIKAGLLERMARQLREDWAPETCPWVGYLDDIAKQIRQLGVAS